MQVEEIVGRERRAAAEFGELGGPAPRLVGRAGGHEQVDDPRAGRTVHGLVAAPGHRNRYALGVTVVVHTRTVRSSICSFTSPHAGHWARTVVIGPTSQIISWPTCLEAFGTGPGALERLGSRVRRG